MRGRVWCGSAVYKTPLDVSGRPANAMGRQNDLLLIGARYRTQTDSSYLIS